MTTDVDQAYSIGALFDVYAAVSELDRVLDVSLYQFGYRQLGGYSTPPRPPKRKYKKRPPEEQRMQRLRSDWRREAIYARRRNGENFVSIASDLNISQQWVRQLFKSQEQRLARRRPTPEMLDVLRSVVGQLQPLL